MREVTLYDRVGGMPFFERLVGRFYAGVADDPVLRPLYPEADLAPATRRLTLFLAQYWGGPTTYSAERGHPRLRARHFPFSIGGMERDRWLVHMRAAIDASDAPDAERVRLHEYVTMAAEAMRNRDDPGDIPRVLVAYATKHGSTGEIAEAIGTELRSAGLEVDVAPARSVRDLAGYDAIVLGSALYAAHWRREANAFVKRHLDALRTRPVWLFSSGPLDRSAGTQDPPITPHVAAVTDPIGARTHRTFAGRLLAEGPGIDAQVLATHPVGDFRDWTQIRRWAAEVGASIRALPATSPR